MSLYIVDASVAVKWFLPEPYTDAALRLCHPDYQLHVPALFDLEFSNIVCKKIRRGELTLEEGYQMRRDIAKVPIQRHRDDSLLTAAFDLANQTYRSLYDCMYLALAIKLEGQLVTADQKLYSEINKQVLRKYLIWVEEI